MAPVADGSNRREFDTFNSAAIGHHARMSGRPGLLGRMVRGAVAGAVATWFMDLATTGYLQTQSPEDAAREKAAQPNGRSSVENMLEFGTGLVGRPH